MAKLANRLSRIRFGGATRLLFALVAAFGARNLEAQGNPQAIIFDGIEINQAIQGLPASVPLIAGKPSWIRVYLSGKSAGRAVNGLLTVTDQATGAATTLKSVESATVMPRDAAPQLALRRQSAALSLNFIVPASVAVGTLAYRSLALADATTGDPLACEGCEAMPTPLMAFRPGTPLRLRVIGFRYTNSMDDGKIVSFTPRPVDHRLLVSWLQRAYPVAELIATHDTVDLRFGLPFDCNKVNAQLASIRATELSEGVDPRTHYYGLVADGGFWMRGCAADIPDVADPSVVASGPAGTPLGSYSWDSDSSYADWYGGHEIAHTFGSYHVGSGCGESPDDSRFPYNPGGFLSLSDDKFVGADAIGLGKPVPLPGRAWHDVMTYCRNQWISDYTYARILKRLEEEATPIVAATQVAIGQPAPIAEGVAATIPNSMGGLNAPNAQQPSRYLHVSATVNITRKQATILSPSPVSEPGQSADGPSQQNRPAATLRMLNANGAVLEERRVMLRFQSDRDPSQPDSIATISAVIRDDPAGARLEILLGTEVVGGYTLAAGKPSLQLTSKMTSAGAGGSADVASISWNRLPNPTLYTVLVRADTGAARVVQETRGTRVDINASLLGELRQGWVIVLANRQGRVTRDSTYIRRPPQ